MKIIICGVSGSGKTTLAQKLKKKYKLHMIASPSTGIAGNQELIRFRAMHNHNSFKIFNQAVMDRCMLDVYAYEKTYLNSDDMFDLALETVREVKHNTLFILLTKCIKEKRDSDDKYSNICREFLDNLRCSYISMQIQSKEG